MLPLGMYASTAVNHESLGSKHSAWLAVHTFLKTCELTLARRNRLREGTLIFSFTPRPDAQFADNQKYIAPLTGEIWIDAKDRIVTRLVAGRRVRFRVRRRMRKPRKTKINGFHILIVRETPGCVCRDGALCLNKAFG